MCPTHDTMDDLDKYSKLFMALIREQAQIIGMMKALELASEAGLAMTPDGEIISCEKDPTLVLLRLIKSFTQSGRLETLPACIPLLNELRRLHEEINLAID